jgi:hypothetical protein
VEQGLRFPSNGRVLIYGAGFTLFVAFALNLYVALVDRNMIAPESIVLTPHYYANWAITVIDIVTSGILFLETNKKWLLALSGIIWPLVYLGLLILDIESRLCFAAPSSTCFPSVAAAESYLLFGRSTIVIVYFWPYTFAVIIALLASSIALSSLGLYFLSKKKVSVALNEDETKKEKSEEQKSK